MREKKNRIYLLGIDQEFQEKKKENIGSADNMSNLKGNSLWKGIREKKLICRRFGNEEQFKHVDWIK
jgi:hypothetical protein